MDPRKKTILPSSPPSSSPSSSGFPLFKKESQVLKWEKEARSADVIFLGENHASVQNQKEQKEFLENIAKDPANKGRKIIYLTEVPSDFKEDFKAFNKGAESLGVVKDGMNAPKGVVDAQMDIYRTARDLKVDVLPFDASRAELKQVYDASNTKDKHAAKKTLVARDSTSEKNVLEIMKQNPGALIIVDSGSLHASKEKIEGERPLAMRLQDKGKKVYSINLDDKNKAGGYDAGHGVKKFPSATSMDSSANSNHRQKTNNQKLPEDH